MNGSMRPAHGPSNPSPERCEARCPSPQGWGRPALLIRETQQERSEFLRPVPFSAPVPAFPTLRRARPWRPKRLDMRIEWESASQEARGRLETGTHLSRSSWAHWRLSFAVLLQKLHDLALGPVAVVHAVPLFHKSAVSAVRGQAHADVRVPQQRRIVKWRRRHEGIVFC
jgi:hypothetical protein